jgi:hypothetical protein
MVLADPMFITHRQQIVERAVKYRLPSIFGGAWVRASGPPAIEE